MQSSYENKAGLSGWRLKLHEIIFEADTFGGKLFDIILLWLILVSVLVVMLESVVDFKLKYGDTFTIIEWVLTALFTLEYIARISTVKKPIKYIISFYGVIDLISILPSYLGVYIGGYHTHTLVTIRSIRLLRVFRILKMGRFLSEASTLRRALIEARPKITVFLAAVLAIVTIMGTIMYMVESAEHGFTSIPRSIYWAIVTLTTVGYGDIAPHTVVGQVFASIIMIMGYAIIAVPTGLVSNELAKTSFSKVSNQACPECSKEGHDIDAEFCKYCGAELNPKKKDI